MFNDLFEAFLGGLGSPTAPSPQQQQPSQAAFMAANPFMSQQSNQFGGMLKNQNSKSKSIFSHNPNTT